MKSRLIIRNGNTITDMNVIESKIVNIDPESIWKNIVQRIKEIKHGYWDGEWNTNGLTPAHLIDSLTWFDGYEYWSSTHVEVLSDIKYYIYVDYYDTIITLKAYHSGNKEQGIICYENRYVIDDKNEGNCIDDFIKRGVEPQIDVIKDLVYNIKFRLPERQITKEYHSTGCYERDFTEISLIKKFAQKIADNCNKQLERISEFYTKLNY